LVLSEPLGTIPGMLSTTTGQVGLFDAAELIGPPPEGSFFALLAEHGERIVCDEDFADCYSENRGRPSIPPSKLAKVLLLQYRTGLSDEQAMEAVAWDLRWKIALGLPVDHRGWSASTLTRYRARLLLHGKERLALENSLALAEGLGLLDGPAEQIVDSTPMLGAAATQDTVRLVRSGVKRLIDAVEAVDGQAAGSLADGLEFDYSKPSQKPDCRWREKAQRERMLTRVAEDAERALRAVEQADGLLGEEAVRDVHALLRELVGQDFDVDSGGVPRLHRGTRQDRILSVHDTEMRHGRKSGRQRFDGFKLHAAATNSDEPLITAVDVAPANEQDGPRAGALVDAQPAERRPERLLGDTAYGTGPVRAGLAERDIEVLAPVPEAPAKDGRIAKREFDIDLEAGTVTCPAGEVAPIRTEPSGRQRASFAKAACDRCPLRTRCVAPARGRKTITIEPHEELMIAARQALDDPQAAEHLRRTRPRIERLLGLLAHRYGARKARYIGAAKARLQALWAAALVNLNPIGRRLTAQAP
jgi:transposase